MKVEIFYAKSYLRSFYPVTIQQNNYIFVQHGLKSEAAIETVAVNLADLYPLTFKRDKVILAQYDVAEELFSGMTTLNLNNHYGRIIEDGLREVKNEIADELFADWKFQQSLKRGERRNNVRSLNTHDGTFELASRRLAFSPDTIVEMKERHCGLCKALNSLPETQGKRIEARYLMGKSVQEIAASEGVAERRVYKSISRGLQSMKKYLINLDKQGAETANNCPDR